MLVISIKFKAQFLLPTFIGSGLDKSRRQVFGGPFSFHLSIILIFNFPRPAPPAHRQAKTCNNANATYPPITVPPTAKPLSVGPTKAATRISSPSTTSASTNLDKSMVRGDLTNLKRGHHVTVKERKESFQRYSVLRGPRFIH